MAAESQFIGQLIFVGMSRDQYNNIRQEMGTWLGAGDCCCWDDAVLDVCCTRC